jgi:hypothetical protein
MPSRPVWVSWSVGPDMKDHSQDTRDHNVCVLVKLWINWMEFVCSGPRMKKLNYLAV